MKKMPRIPILGFFAATFILLIAIVFFGKVFGYVVGPDAWCSRVHRITYGPVQNPKTPLDYFELGNYDYDSGNCQQAIADYTTSIKLDPSNPQTYNNRAYTNMRLRNYKDALSDLNKAIELRSGYADALANRGDLYNYYGPVIDRNKAIEDYNKAILTGSLYTRRTVCGHRAMAQTNNLLPLAFLKFILNRGNC